ncbi:hypothetical protein BV911_02870 [Pseudoruegeria sp. SK021]|nr:hypothetical protein BV911_02870 [Pseudoruegeria sp. SK021]
MAAILASIQFTVWFDPVAHMLRRTFGGNPMWFLMRISVPGKVICKTTIGPDDSRVPRRRGSLTVWFDAGKGLEFAPSGMRGRQQSYSDAAIQARLRIKVLFGMAGR